MLQTLFWLFQCSKNPRWPWRNCNDDDWYRDVVGQCVNKDEAPVNVEGIFHIEENFNELNKPVQKCPETFRGWNTAWNTEYPLE